MLDIFVVSKVIYLLIKLIVAYLPYVPQVDFSE